MSRAIRESYPEEGVPLAAAWQRGPRRAQEEARVLVGLGVGTGEGSGRAEPPAKAQRWAGHGGAGLKDGAHCARMERLREGGREPDPERPQIPCRGTWTLSSRLWGEHRGCVSKSQAEEKGPTEVWSRNTNPEPCEGTVLWSGRKPPAL